MRGPFTTTEARRELEFSDRSVRGWLNELAEFGAVKVVEKSRGKAPAVWELTGESLQEKANVLPDVEEVCKNVV
jgi:hypothetical protein